MEVVLLAARLLLAAVFVTSALSKLADLNGSRKALRDFGVPGGLATPLGILLPLAELGIAVALLPVRSLWLAAVAALSLLVVFMLAISINLALGRTPDCHCFGQLHSAPAGWSTVARNAFLASAAGLVVWQGRSGTQLSVADWFGDLSTAQRVGLLGGGVGFTLLTLQGVVLLQMLRQQGRLLLRLDAIEGHLVGSVPAAAKSSTLLIPGLALGLLAPSFRLKGLRGETMTLDALVALGKPVLLLFASPNCGPCEVLMPDISHWQREHSASLTIAIVSEGKAIDNRAKSGASGVSQVLLQKKREVAESYQVRGTPGAVLVRTDGTIGSGVALGAEAIRMLVAQAESLAGSAIPGGDPSRPAAGNNGRNGSHGALHPPVAKLGEPAPALSFSDLNGKTVSLKDFSGEKTLLLFWNPSCGYCQQMLADLKEWESSGPPRSPKLVVISTGTLDENRAMNLRSLVVLAQDSRAGAAFGANGTPMAVLLDGYGRIASEVAAGAQAVLALADSSDLGGRSDNESHRPN